MSRVSVLGLLNSVLQTGKQLDILTAAQGGIYATLQEMFLGQARQIENHIFHFLEEARQLQDQSEQGWNFWTSIRSWKFWLLSPSDPTAFMLTTSVYTIYL